MVQQARGWKRKVPFRGAFVRLSSNFKCRSILTTSTKVPKYHDSGAGRLTKQPLGRSYPKSPSRGSDRNHMFSLIFQSTFTGQHLLLHDGQLLATNYYLLLLQILPLCSFTFLPHAWLCNVPVLQFFCFTGPLCLGRLYSVTVLLLYHF